MSTRLDAGLEPRQFGPYRVVREIGSGGMARVYEGRHPELDSPVAIKVMHPALAAQPRAAARFLREARAAAQVRHQHVIQVFDVGANDALPYMVMEYLEGADLATLLRERGALPVRRAVELLLPVISGVAAAHDAGVIHRDLKPANVFLARRPPRTVHPIVLDFGISKLAADDSQAMITRSDALLGTVQYMAPELTKGAGFASRLTDQYALGVILYECLTGRRPFQGESHYELMHAIVTAPLVPPSALTASVHPDLEAIVLKALEREPDARFPSLRALGSALLAFGERNDFARWQADFLGMQSGVAELWTQAPDTLCEADTGTQHRKQPPSGAETRWARRAIVALVTYAAALTAWLLASPERVPPSARTEWETEIPSAPAAPSAPSVAERRAETRPDAPFTELPVPQVERDAPAAGSRQSARRPIRSATPPPRRPVSPSAAPTASAAPATKPLIGSNSSLIFD